jgi:hypothetical protein
MERGVISFMVSRARSISEMAGLGFLNVSVSFS